MSFGYLAGRAACAQPCRYVIQRLWERSNYLLRVSPSENRFIQ